MWPNQYGYNPKFPEPNEQDNYKQGFDELKILNKQKVMLNN